MADVFICYDEDSAESVARQISATLERDGISCWYIGRDMEKGALRGAITEAIEDCRVFLLILSKRSIHSEYVKNEIALAVRGFDDNRKRELIAFRVDNANAEAQLDAFLDELRARDDFPSDIPPFRVMDGCPPDKRHIVVLAILLNWMLNSAFPSSLASIYIAAGYVPIANLPYPALAGATSTISDIIYQAMLRLKDNASSKRTNRR